jgi:hypothetical protein
MSSAKRSRPEFGRLAHTPQSFLLPVAVVVAVAGRLLVAVAVAVVTLQRVVLLQYLRKHGLLRLAAAVLVALLRLRQVVPVELRL